MSSKTKKSKSNKHKIRVCSRHNCHKRKGVKRCKFCKELFCEEHIEPFTPHVGLDTRTERREGDGGHPCFAYAHYKENEDKGKAERDMENLDRLLGKKRISKTKNIGKSEEVYFNVKENVSEEPKKKSSKKKNEDMGKLAIKKFEEKETRRKEESPLSVGIIIWIIIIVGLAYLAYANWEQIGDYIDNFDSVEEIAPTGIQIDAQTLEAFGHINNYRSKSGSLDLIYSEELYEWVKSAAQMKDVNPDSFKTSTEFRNAIEAKLDLSKISSSYYATYFIGGGGVDEFSTQFNKSYNVRNIIKKPKYNYGAVYCSLDYCILFIFENKGDLLDTVESARAPSSEVSSDENIIFIGGNSLKISPDVGYERYRGISYDVNYEGDGGDSNFLVAEFNDPTGYYNKKCYRIIQRTVLEDKLICEKCSESVTGEIRCSIQEADGRGILIGSLYGTPGSGGPRYWIGQDTDLYDVVLEYFK